MKSVGSLPSLIQGVSEQEPHNRAPGKMWESVNCIDSPTRGKARRRGSVYSDHVQLAATAGALDEAKRMEEYTFIIDGREYALIYRPFASSLGSQYFAQLLSKSDGEFYPITYEDSTWVQSLITGGVSAITCAGRTVLLAGHTTTPRATSVNLWQEPSNIQKLAAWIREGAYSRKFTVRLYREDNTYVEYSYTTKPAAYPELLDTTDIPFYLPGGDGTEPDPEYQKKVNDRVNAYEGERSAWIKEAAEDIVPSNIAAKIAELMQIDNIAASSMGPCVLVDDPEFVDIRAYDDAANTLVSYAGKEITSPEQVTLYHWDGKIVRVRPTTGDDSDAYYLKAVGLDGQTGWTKVEWVEAAGVEHTIHNVVSQLAIDVAAKRAYVAQDDVGLETLAPSLGDLVAYKKNLVGDGITAPIPQFFGRTITAMAMFQDRLLVMADNVVNTSRSGDYFNFFRKTVLNILDTDPVSMFAYGSEGDTIKRAVMYDQSLILFGELRQYKVDGRTFLSPQAPKITVIGAYENGADAQPIASGNYLFFGKRAEGRTGMHEMQPGETPETTIVYDVGEELDTYIKGNPVQLLGTTKPNMVTFRTDASGSIWYLYRYADDRNVGRVLASWGKFEYAEVLGTVAGITHFDGELYIVTLRNAGGQDYWFADRLSLNVDLWDRPYMDSQIALGEETPWHLASAASLSLAVRKTHPSFLMGCPREDLLDFIEQAPDTEEHIVVGAVTPAYFQMTNPYMRTQDGLPILNARLTLTSYSLHLADTAGLRAFVLKPDRERTLWFEGRVAGMSNNVAGVQPIFTGTRLVSVGRETGSCIVEIRSEDWLPLRVTGAEWAGQSFMPRARGLY